LTEYPDSDISGRLDYMTRRVLARSPSVRESESLGRFFSSQIDYFQKNPVDATRQVSIGLSSRDEHKDEIQLAAWTSVARVLLNRNESITRN